MFAVTTHRLPIINIRTLLYGWNSQTFYCIAQNLEDMVVHEWSVKVSLVNNFILSDLLCQAEFLPVSFCQNVFGQQLSIATKVLYRMVLYLLSLMCLKFLIKNLHKSHLRSIWIICKLYIVTTSWVHIKYIRIVVYYTSHDKVMSMHFGGIYFHSVSIQNFLNHLNVVMQNSMKCLSVSLFIVMLPNTGLINETYFILLSFQAVTQIE